ncbi:MAG: V-type ATP synthase subunit I [Actinobacteria bacterium]|nr:MAG: V-type ATP synthase subunit I [Actinomycetota bacterium]
MAVAKMLHLRIITHNSLKAKLLLRLQDKGLIQIETKQIETTSNQETLQELTDKLAQINSAIDFLSNHKKEKKGFLSSIIPSKIKVDKDYFYNIENEIALNELIASISQLEVDYHHTNGKIQEHLNTEAELKPWKKLDYIVHSNLSHTEIVPGHISHTKTGNLIKALNQTTKYYHLDEISTDQKYSYLVLYYHKNVKEKILPVLSKQKFCTVFLPSDIPPASFYDNAVARLLKLKSHKQQLNDKIIKSYSLSKELLIAKNYIENQINKLSVEGKLKNTKHTVLFEGWLPEKNKAKLEKLLADMGKEIEWSFSQPGKSDKVPIVLDNPKWLKPLEVVTTLYGYPSYWEKDPTPHLAFFFLLFFGIAIGDVGYGIVISLAAWALMKKLDVGQKGRDFLKLFIYGGIACIPAGILTGSWFAIDMAILPPFLKNLAVVDPMNNPMPFLIFCLALGFIHLYWGVIVALLDGFRNSPLNSLMENVPVLVFLPGFALVIILAFYSSFGITVSWSPYAKWLALVGAALIVIFTNHQGKNIFSKIGGGLYNLYGMSGYIGDIISYSRLMALGLATFLIGQAINIIARMAPSIFIQVLGQKAGLIIGVIAAILIIVVGHVFNIVINLISAFIHPARLQYVEFFTKFFRGGGSKFEPFSIKSKELNIT